MIFPNISFFHMVVTDWTGPLKNTKNKTKNALRASLNTPLLFREEQNNTKIIQFEHCFGLLKRKS